MKGAQLVFLEASLGGAGIGNGRLLIHPIPPVKSTRQHPTHHQRQATPDNQFSIPRDPSALSGRGDRHN